MLIGLTGMYCAGKNQTAALLEQRGIQVLDVDRLGHLAVESRKEAVCACFGSGLLNPDGTVNRKLLGERVFGKPDKLAALEAIVHPEANRLTEEWLAARRGTTCAVNAALIHKSSVFERLDLIMVVTAPFFTRLIRAKKRDGLSWPALLRRFASQRQFNAQYLAKNADIYRVENRGFSKTALRRYSAKLERRLDDILSISGIDLLNQFV